MNAFRHLFISIVSIPMWSIGLQADVVLFATSLASEETVALSEAGHEGQSGEAAPLDFLFACRGSDPALVPVNLDDRGLVIENNQATFASVTPALDFSQAGGDGFRLRIDIAPEPGSISYSRDRWAQIHFGGGQPNRFVWAQGFGILIRSDASRDDGYQIFHNGQNVASGRVAAAEVYQFDIIVEDGELAFTINGQLQSPFAGGSPTYPVGTLRLGYVTFGSHQASAGAMVSAFSNFSLERLEVESSSLLILSSLSTTGSSIPALVAR